MNLIQLLTDQRAYKGITHSRWGASWNWWWRRVGDDEERRSPLWSPKRTPDLASQWRTGGGSGSVSWIVIILSPWFYSRKIGFYSIGFRVCGATRWGQPAWGRLEEVACPYGLCPPRCPLPWFLAPEILFYCIKNPRKVSFHSDNFYFCTKTTRGSSA